MNFSFFTIPVNDHAIAKQELNQFLVQHKILSLNESFVDNGVQSFWAFSVSYLPATPNSTEAMTMGAVTSKQRNSVDYKDILNEEDFKIYSHLRDIRKAIAQEQGAPPYIVFTNEQLATMIIEKANSKTKLLAIHGIGQKKVDKYGELFLSYLQSEFGKAIEGEAIQ